MSVTYHNIHSQSLETDIDGRFESELRRLRDDEPALLGHWVAGESRSEGAVAERFDPSERTRLGSRYREADGQLIEAAVSAGRGAQPAWAALGFERRSEFLLRARQVFLDRKPELAAASSFETGKPRIDAIAEVEECIALIDGYTAQIRAEGGYTVEMAAPQGAETTEIQLRPFGVFGVIAPFNFPLAIPITMSAAALAMGNAVVLKPSALTPRCGEALAQIFSEAGLPDGVFNLVQGGASTGTALTQSSVDGMAFTGSADVGLSILGHLVRPPFNRPVLAEMGGKNPAIVSRNWSDVAMAARATARSAYGMTGQKCNACSRVIVDTEIHDEFVAALIDEARQLKIGDPLDPESFGGPLVNQASLDRFEKAVEEARNDGEIALGGGAAEDGGLYAELTVVTGLEPGHPLTRRELFHPFLTVTPYTGLDQAIAEANAVRFGLSAGIFSSDSAERERFLAEIQAGIVFVNNPAGATTGVWPGSQSMAGWKASGTTGKGGFGPWYLTQFGREQSRTIFPA